VIIIEFQAISDVLKSREGEKVAIRGWVYRKREFKDKVFLVVRDSSGVLQCVVRDKFPKIFNSAKKATIESSIELEGILRKDPRAPGGYELDVNYLKLIHIAEPFPITKSAVDAASDFLLDVRHLWIRSRRMTAILKVRDTIFKAIHEFFRKRGFYEVQAPMFVTAAVEGGATLFKVDYFNRKDVYLTQSSQFYLEVLIYSLEKVYTIAPSFRAEKSRTRRHLTEFWHAEAEVAWTGLDDLMRLEEDLIAYIVDKVLEERSEELGILNRNTSILENIKTPFPRLSYDEVISILQDKGFNIKWGDDLGSDEERALTLDFDKPIFVYGYPEACKAFYHKPMPSRPEVTLSADMLAPEGYGEVIGGGERIEDLEVLISKINKFGLNPDDYKWYVDLRRYGSVPHSGFGLGIDRLVMWICGLNHIREAVPFPRDIRKVYP